ncbi:MAG: nucleoside-diphosphate kinase [Deltaproteobacteria bacterium]|nr:nucleoside-diphosphate kinase [Deltaproteobacteria bacterium]
MELGVSFLPPHDGVQSGLVGEVIKRFEKAGFKIVAMKMVHLSKEQANEFYAAHKGRSYFEGLTDFMSSGPSVAVALEGQNIVSKYREMMGATDPVQAAEGTIRKAYATDGRQNVVHGSDSRETAAFEIGYFFSAFELVGP